QLALIPERQAAAGIVPGAEEAPAPAPAPALTEAAPAQEPAPVMGESVSGSLSPTQMVRGGKKLVLPKKKISVTNIKRPQGGALVMESAASPVPSMELEGETLGSADSGSLQA
ncbi:MAG: hypothetical protein ACI4OS_06860, partial [Akkermansia sp.]